MACAHMQRTTKLRIAQLLVTFVPTVAFAADKIQNINWGLCPVEAEGEQRPSSEGLEPGFSALAGDEATLVEGGTSTFSGNVELVRDDHALRTARLSYDEPNEIVDAQGHT